MGSLIHLTQPKHGQQNGKVKQSPDNGNDRKVKQSTDDNGLSVEQCTFTANKEPLPHASGEPSLQHLKVFDYELIGIIVI
jgi:hypothetical protein